MVEVVGRRDNMNGGRVVVLVLRGGGDFMVVDAFERGKKLYPLFRSLVTRVGNFILI